MDAGGSGYIRRIEQLDEAAEVTLLNGILAAGFDQGCFLRPAEHELLPIEPSASEAVLAALDARGLHPEATEADPFADAPLPSTTIDGVEPGFVVLTQRCDLVRPLLAEPFVELAHAWLVTDIAVRSAAKKNSGRFIHIADGEDAAWVADLRRRAVLAKDCLTSHAAVQPVDNGEAHKRFKLRIGQRYSRDALPTDIVEKLQRPLVGLLRKKPAHLKLVDVFSNFLVFRAPGDKVEVVALYPERVSRDEAEDRWQALEELLPEGLLDYIDENRSGAVPITQVNFWRYFSGWKLDLDEVTYAGKAGPNQEPPTL